MNAYDTGNLMVDMLPHPKFRTVYLDPPWPTSGNMSSRWTQGGWTSTRDRPAHKYTDRMRRRQYPQMAPGELLSLPVGEIAAPDAVIVMWATWSVLDLAMECLKAWGFRYASGRPWVKVTSTGKYAWGTGMWFAHCTECMLVGRRGKPFGSMGNPRPAARGLIVAPRQEHSAKPPEVRDWCKDKLPGPHVELFARTLHPGWVSWGDQL